MKRYLLDRIIATVGRVLDRERDLQTQSKTDLALIRKWARMLKVD